MHGSLGTGWDPLGSVEHTLGSTELQDCGPWVWLWHAVDSGLNVRDSSEQVRLCRWGLRFANNRTAKRYATGRCRTGGSNNIHCTAVRSLPGRTLAFTLGHKNCRLASHYFELRPAVTGLTGSDQYLNGHVRVRDLQHCPHIFFILVINQLGGKNLFYNKFISCLYMFRAPCAHRQEVKTVLYSLWYRHTFRWPSGAQSRRGLLSLSTCAPDGHL